MGEARARRPWRREQARRQAARRLLSSLLSLLSSAYQAGARVFAAAAPGGVFFTATAADARERGPQGGGERAEEQANRTVL